MVVGHYTDNLGIPNINVPMHLLMPKVYHTKNVNTVLIPRIDETPIKRHSVKFTHPPEETDFFKKELCP